MTTNKRWWGCGEKGTLCTVGGNVSWHSHWGKLNGGFTKKKKKKKQTNKPENKTTQDSFIHFWVLF